MRENIRSQEVQEDIRQGSVKLRYWPWVKKKRKEEWKKKTNRLHKGKKSEVEEIYDVSEWKGKTEKKLPLIYK